MNGICRVCTATGLLALLAFAAPCSCAQAGELYRKPPNTATRWSSFENMNGKKGAGGMENRGAKGHPFHSIRAGESIALLDIKEPGMITRMWFTVNDRTTATLRSLRLDMYWDGAQRPAVSVPFGEFFGAILARPVAFESELLSNPEGKSFNCCIPMPFREGARVVVTNESSHTIRLLFYDIDYLVRTEPDRTAMYFHAHWRRESPTQLGRDFEILPRVEGAGRFLGANIGLQCDRRNPGWWGEGEVKMYIDGDTTCPTIVGTGTEDYIGTGWGQGKFSHRYQGCLVNDENQGLIGFYRYHVPDPVYFDRDIRVTLQQMGGDAKTSVAKALADGLEILPVTASWVGTGNVESFVRLLEKEPAIDIRKDDVLPAKAWTNYYRRDDVSAVAYFYLDRPENNLPPLRPASERLAGMK